MVFFFNETTPQHGMGPRNHIGTSSLAVLGPARVDGNDRVTFRFPSRSRWDSRKSRTECLGTAPPCTFDNPVELIVSSWERYTNITHIAMQGESLPAAYLTMLKNMFVVSHRYFAATDTATEGDTVSFSFAKNRTSVASHTLADRHRAVVNSSFLLFTASGSCTIINSNFNNYARDPLQILIATFY